jgi:NADPH2:quinone reductase
MRAALIEELGRPPVIGEAPEPAARDGELLVDVECVPLNPIDIAIGAGRFYGGHPPLPFVPGAEAVGRRRDTGERVWTGGGRTGNLAEVAVCSSVTPVPDDADPALAGACGIAGMAGWLPVVWRAPVRADDRVLVLGATGTVGLVALQAAKLRGAHVVAAGRDPAGLERALQSGADEAVQLDEIGRFEPTYVIDPLWGPPLEAAVEAAAPGARLVNIGQSAGAEATLRSADVRGKQLEVYGYSNFAVPRDVLEREYASLVDHVIRGDVQIDVERVPFDEVAEAWQRQAGGSAQAKLVVCL